MGIKVVNVNKVNLINDIRQTHTHTYRFLLLAPTTIQVPQPIFVHTGPSGGFQPQYHQQTPWNPTPIMMTTSPESRPMLPHPSAPPHPHDYIHSEHLPPAYEKLYK